MPFSFFVSFTFLPLTWWVRITSLGIIIVAVVGGLIAFQTGEQAEETVENIAGISHDSIEAHEEAGEISNVFFIGLGLLSIVAVYFEMKKKIFSKQVLIAVLALSLITFYFVARTATLGGEDTAYRGCCSRLDQASLRW